MDIDAPHLSFDRQPSRQPEDRTTALVVACADSAIRSETLKSICPDTTILSLSPGNTVAPIERANWIDRAWIQYAIENLLVRRIIVCGHLRCPMMARLIVPKELQRPGEYRRYSHYARPALKHIAKQSDLNDQERLQYVTVRNVEVQLENVASYPVVRQALLDGRIQLEGWLHDPRTHEMIFVAPWTAPSASALPPVYLQ